MNTETQQAFERICDPNDIRKQCVEPYSLTLAGKGKASVASNGHVMVVIPGVSGDYPELPQDHREAVDKHMSAKAWLAAHRREVNLDDLKAWAGSPCYDRPCDCEGKKQCTKCEGEGCVPCECSECGHEHEIDCKDCDGLGHFCESCRGNGIISKPVNPGRLMGLSIDCTLLANALACLEGDKAVLYIEPDRGMAKIENESGKVLVMGMRNIREYPAGTYLEPATA